MQQKKCLKTIIFFTVFITFLSGAKAVLRQEFSVEDLLYKGRLKLTDNNPTDALEYFKKALNQCEPGSPQYDSRYGRCNFFIGEAYFQRYEMEKNVSDAKAAIKYFEAVIDFGEKTSQDYPSLAKGRIRQIQRALSATETGVSSETDRTFKVKTVPKGKIIANSWNLYVNGERIDNPFVELFFVEDHSSDTPETLRNAVYMSDAGAAEVARRLGIKRFAQKRYNYDRYSVLNVERKFCKPGYTDLVLIIGERFNGQWAIIEYDLNMPALPVKLFEHFGASVQVNLPERKVEISAKADMPETKDWFESAGAWKLPAFGAGGDWIIGFRDIMLPREVSPGQLVEGRVDLKIKEIARDSAGAVIHISLFGDWTPGTELVRLYERKVGEPRSFSIPFNFTAPTKPGKYHLRFPMVLAYAPVKNYYGSKPAGQNDPGIGPYTEVSFVVVEPQANEPTTRQKPAGECICTQDSSRTWHCTYKYRELRGKDGIFISYDMSKCFWGWTSVNARRTPLGDQCYAMSISFASDRRGEVSIGVRDLGLLGSKNAILGPVRYVHLIYPGSDDGSGPYKYREEAMQSPYHRFFTIKDGLSFNHQFGPLNCTFFVEKADIQTWRNSIDIPLYNRPDDNSPDLIIQISIAKR